MNEKIDCVIENLAPAPLSYMLIKSSKETEYNINRLVVNAVHIRNFIGNLNYGKLRSTSSTLIQMFSSVDFLFSSAVSPNDFKKMTPPS